jgi:hypothetical protein
MVRRSVHWKFTTHLCLFREEKYIRHMKVDSNEMMQRSSDAAAADAATDADATLESLVTERSSNHFELQFSQQQYSNDYCSR